VCTVVARCKVLSLRIFNLLESCARLVCDSSLIVCVIVSFCSVYSSSGVLQDLIFIFLWFIVVHVSVLSIYSVCGT
jgi:hypothetical protein